MADYIGLVCGATTGQIFAIINPDEDSELDNPRWLLIQIAEAQREPLTMLKMEMTEYMNCTSHDEVQTLARTKLGL